MKLPWAKEKYNLVVVDVDGLEKGTVMGTFDHLPAMKELRYMMTDDYEEETGIDKLASGRYSVIELSTGKVVRKLVPKKEVSPEDLKRMKEEKAMEALKEAQRDALASVNKLKDMKEVMKKEFDLGDGDVVDDIDIPPQVESVLDALRIGFARRTYVDIMREPGNMGKNINDAINAGVKFLGAGADFLSTVAKDKRGEKVAKESKAEEKIEKTTEVEGDKTITKFNAKDKGEEENND